MPLSFCLLGFELSPIFIGNVQFLNFYQYLIREVFKNPILCGLSGGVILKGSRIKNNYFRLLIEGESSSAAELLLRRLEQRLEDGDWSKGYINALEGMLLQSRSRSSRNPLVVQVREDPSEAASMIEDFRRRSEQEWGSDFDRGYFRAWTDFLEAILRYKRD